MDPRDRLIVALDFPSAAAALALVDVLGDLVLWYKVGLQLYLAEGRVVVDELRRRKKVVFLDLKLHDIPNTVAGAVNALHASGAKLLTVHGSGGPAMLQKAAEASAVPGGPTVLAVTVLTSMDDDELGSVGIGDGSAAQVMRLAEAAVKSGIRGLVCSPQEIAALRRRFGEDLLLVVPGIRSVTDTGDDQRRTATAGEAIRTGATMLVVGRPVTQAADPRLAVQMLLQQIEAAQA